MRTIYWKQQLDRILRVTATMLIKLFTRRAPNAETGNLQTAATLHGQRDSVPITDARLYRMLYRMMYRIVSSGYFKYSPW